MTNDEPIGVPATVLVPAQVRDEDHSAAPAEGPSVKRLDFVWVVDLHPAGPEGADPMSRLYGRVDVLGASFHVNLEQVRDNADGEQESVLPVGDTYVEDIQNMCEGAGETITIDGREYLMVIEPFQR